MIPPFSSYPAISPTSRDCYNPSSTPILQESQPRSHSPEVCIDPFSTQVQLQPPLPTGEQLSAAENSSLTCKVESADVPTVSSNAQSTESVDNTSPNSEPCIDLYQLPAHDTSYSISSNVVYPPRDACLEYAIPIEYSYGAPDPPTVFPYYFRAFLRRGPSPVSRLKSSCHLSFVSLYHILYLRLSRFLLRKGTYQMLRLHGIHRHLPVAQILQAHHHLLNRKTFHLRRMTNLSK